MKKIFKKIGLIAVSFLASIGLANAALPASATAAFTTLETDTLAMVDLAWPVMVAITVAFILLRVFKRAASSSV